VAPPRLARERGGGRARQERLQRDRTQAERQAAGLESRDVEDRLDQVGEALALLGQDAQRPLALRWQQRGVLGDQLERAGDIGERRPQLVRDERDELRLESVDLAQLLVGACQLGVDGGELPTGRFDVGGPFGDDRLQATVHRCKGRRRRLVREHQATHPPERDADGDRSAHGQEGELGPEPRRE
jgi:hypothetical protein